MQSPSFKNKQNFKLTIKIDGEFECKYNLQ